MDIVVICINLLLRTQLKISFKLNRLLNTYETILDLYKNNNINYLKREVIMKINYTI